MGGADPGEEEPLLIAAVPNEGAVGWGHEDVVEGAGVPDGVAIGEGFVTQYVGDDSIAEGWRPHDPPREDSSERGEDTSGQEVI